MFRAGTGFGPRKSSKVQMAVADSGLEGKQESGYGRQSQQIRNQVRAGMELVLRMESKPEGED